MKREKGREKRRNKKEGRIERKHVLIQVISLYRLIKKKSF